MPWPLSWWHLSFPLWETEEPLHGLLPVILGFLFTFVLSRSVVSDSLPLHKLYPARLLCPWDSPSKNTGDSCHFLLQRILLTQGSFPRLLRWQADSLPLSHLGRFSAAIIQTQPLTDKGVVGIVKRNSRKTYQKQDQEPCWTWMGRQGFHSKLAPLRPSPPKAPQLGLLSCTQNLLSLWVERKAMSTARGPSFGF